MKKRNEELKRETDEPKNEGDKNKGWPPLIPVNHIIAKQKH